MAVVVKERLNETETEYVQIPTTIIKLCFSPLSTIA
jgi:hypothetical protein